MSAPRAVLRAVIAAGWPAVFALASVAGAPIVHAAPDDPHAHAVPDDASAPAAPVAPPAPEDERQAQREAREAMRSGHFDAPTIAWREGPARYLLSANEDQEYRRLKSREERARFVTRFWETRDPDPNTPENEFKELFDRRVAGATALFSAESTKPGWKTDRGKIFILLGPPDDFDETLRQDNVPVITWTYRDPPAGTTASPNTLVRFVRDASGEYRLITNLRIFAGDTPLASALALQAMQVRRDRPGLSALDRVAGADGGAPAAGAPPGAEGRRDDPQAAMWTRAEFFRAAPDLVLVVLTVAIREELIPPGPADAPPAIEIAARLAGTDPGGRTYDLAGARSLVAGRPIAGSVQNGRRLFQGGAVVRPGPYHAYFAAVAHGSNEVYSAGMPVLVPDLDDSGLQVGAIGLAAHCERLAERQGPDFVPPFVLGRQRCVPRLAPVMGRDDELAFYFQVRGAATDPIEGLPDLDITYRFFTVSGGGAAAPFGYPIHLTREQAHLQGFSLPAAGWAAGSYRLRVTVTDNLTGREASSELAFRVR